MCVAAGCGNGIIESGEQCEGSDLNGASCVSIGYEYGNLACDSSCQYDTISCGGVRSFCGDGVKNALEGCDGSDFGATLRACSAYGLGARQISCSAPTCHVMFDSCGTPDLCALQGWYNDGVCDLCEWYSMTARRDPDCGDAIDLRACGMDGVCADYFDGLMGYFGCKLTHGTRDPDCGCGCGNGVVAPLTSEGLTREFCDGSTFGPGVSAARSAWGFSTGSVTCKYLCRLEFDQSF